MVAHMNHNSVRIIGGTWRGRKLRVLDQPDLRPTPDRVRETLFNWLAPYIAGSRCLDLFAGSGALGFEALSRGASYVEMIDQSPAVIALLKSELQTFGTTHAGIHCKTIPHDLTSPKLPFDIIFIDPPYQANSQSTVIRYLETHAFLASPAYIYIEAATPLAQSLLPANWCIIKAKRAGHVAYHLIRRETNDD